LPKADDCEGTTKWHINQNFNGNSGLNFVETGVADGRLFIQAGGNVGVGTTTPTNTLHVNSNTGIRQNRLYLSGGDGWSSLTYNAYHNSANNNWVFPDSSHKSVTIEMDDANGVPRFEVWSTTSGATTSWTQRLAINGDSGNVLMAHHGGNVGIGTTNPLGTLDVNGRILRNGQSFTLGGVANNNDTVTVPWGTTSEWSIFVAPRIMGEEEPGSEGDNALLKIECFATPSTGTTWQIRARYKFKYSNSNPLDGTWKDGTANYILVPS
jgi:hypothetical protein